MSLMPSSRARQPARAAWSMEHLIVECSITLVVPLIALLMLPTHQLSTPTSPSVNSII